MASMHDLAIRWSDHPNGISRIRKLGGVTVWGYPKALKNPGGKVAVVVRGGFVPLEFVVGKIEGPQKVKLAGGQKRNGYIIKAERGSIRSLSPKSSYRLAIHYRAVGQWRYFSAKTHKGLTLDSKNWGEKNYLSDSVPRAWEKGVSKSQRKTSIQNIKDVHVRGKNSVSTSRTGFIKSLGATCKNWQWSWSFVNNEKRFVIFGEWQGRSDRKPGLIFSNDWEIRNGRVNRGFRQGLEHIRLINEDGYKLFTFPMIADEKDEKTQGRVRIKRFTDKVTEKSLLRKENGWYAVPLRKGLRKQNGIKTNGKDSQIPWTRGELKSALFAYLEMLRMQKAGKPFNKTGIYRALASKIGRSHKSIEYRMENITFALQLSGRSTVAGLAPASNVGTNVLGKIEDILAEIENRAPDPEFKFNAEVFRIKKKLPRNIPQGSTSPRKKNTASTVYVRSPEVVSWVQANAKGKCESCGKKGPFMTSNNEFYLEVHHVHFLFEGGADTIENAVAVCPNCHKGFHFSMDKENLTEQLYQNVKRLIKVTK